MSLKNQDVALTIALLDASNDARVQKAINLSGLKFAYHRVGPDNGQAAAISEGWENLCADVLFWLNADDQLLPGALSLVAACFAGSDSPEVAFGGSEFIGENQEILGFHDKVKEPIELLFRSNIISQPSCFIKRKALDAVGGIDRDLHYVMDWDLWIRLYRAGARFQRIDHTLSLVYMGEDTKTSEYSLRRLREVFTLVKRNAGIWAAVKSTASVAEHTFNRRWRQIK